MAGQLLRFAAPQLTSLQQWRGLAPIFGGLAARWACTGAESAAIIVPMPKLSPSMTVGTVSKWLKVGSRMQAPRMHAGCTCITGCLRWQKRATKVHVCHRGPAMRSQSSMWSWRWTQRGSRKRRTKLGSLLGMSPCWSKPRQGLPCLPQGHCIAWHVSLFIVIFPQVVHATCRLSTCSSKMQDSHSSHGAPQEEGYLHSILVKEGEQVPVGTPVALMAELEESLPGLDGYKLPVSNVYMEGASSTVRALSWQSYLKSDEGSSSRGCD